MPRIAYIIMRSWEAVYFQRPFPLVYEVKTSSLVCYIAHIHHDIRVNHNTAIIMVN